MCKQAKHPSANEYIKMKDIFIPRCISQFLKGRKLGTVCRTMDEHGGTALKETDQAQEDKYYLIPLT